MDRNLSHGLVAGSAFSRSRFEESLRCKSTKSSLRFRALDASTRYEGISLRLVFLMSGSEVIEVLDTVEADLELLYEVRRESYIVRPLTFLWNNSEREMTSDVPWKNGVTAS